VSSAGALLATSPYAGYAYGYPHKTAYRPLESPVPLRDAWAEERDGALFLYIHIPFCEMRCGFCNLFTQARPKEDLAERYMAALERQARRTREALGDPRFARIAVGGGTPTDLSIERLEAVFDIAERVMGASPQSIPVSVETSPETAAHEKLALLRARGADRISIGVQSFFEAETSAVSRPQRRADVLAALDRIRALGFPTLNVDLMYGLPGQTVESFLASIREALAWRPEELYLYPLYVRPLTRMGRSEKSWDDTRLELYREARAILFAEGYTQASMRMFRAASSSPSAPPGATSSPRDVPVYRCQEDGMVGIGCGARSYTRGLHYSTEFAVGARGVREILDAYVQREGEAFDVIDYGIELSQSERQRRYVILCVLSDEGLDFSAYRERFGSDAAGDFEELSVLEELGLARRDDGALKLTERGIERSDAIGPWLYSRDVCARMEGFALR
jgi:oxygen-independent coproporphyrinogen-3 oxidase